MSTRSRLSSLVSSNWGSCRPPTERPSSANTKSTSGQGKPQSTTQGEKTITLSDCCPPNNEPLMRAQPTHSYPALVDNGCCAFPNSLASSSNQSPKRPRDNALHQVCVILPSSICTAKPNRPTKGASVHSSCRRHRKNNSRPDRKAWRHVLQHSVGSGSRGLAGLSLSPVSTERVAIVPGASSFKGLAGWQLTQLHQRLHSQGIFGSKPFSLEQHIAHACAKLFNGSQGWASIAIPAAPSLAVPSQRDGAKAQGKYPRCHRCPVHEGVGVKELRNMHVRQPETFHSRRNPDEVQVGASNKITSCSQLWQFLARGATLWFHRCSRSRQQIEDRSSSSAKKWWYLERWAQEKVECDKECWRQRNVLQHG